MRPASFRICLAILGVLVTTAGLADVVTVETLGWRGTGATNGWRYVSLATPFPDGAARFGAQVVSPTWREMDILGIDVKLRCSTSAPSRYLQVSFLRNNRIVAGPRRFEPVFRPDVAEVQSVPANREKHANGFILSVSEGDVGDWGAYEIHVVMSTTTRERTGLLVMIE